MIATRSRLIFALSLLLAVDVACGARALWLAKEQRVVKGELAQVNSIRNGLFSVDVWKTHVRAIVAEHVMHLQLTTKEEADLQTHLETLLRTMIAEADTAMRRVQPTLKGKVRKIAYETLIDVQALDKHVPEMARAILREAQKPANLAKLKEAALAQLNRYVKETRDSESRSATVERALAKYGASTRDEFKARAQGLIESYQSRLRALIALMLASFVAILGLWWSLRRRGEHHAVFFAFATSITFVILGTSLALPMIDVDARIQDVDFVLLREHIQFSDQVLYYRSKSVLQVVTTLVESAKGDAIFVGILLLVFSVLFPVVKLVSSVVVLLGEARWRKHKVVQFFAFQSGKWSMADVMVVAMFMAYSGFNGILNDRMKALNVAAESWQMIATNQTTLQPGFALFVGFVLAGLALSEILKRISPQGDTD
jgi:hypothetical protein